MLNFQQKWKTKTFIYSRPVRIILGIIVVYSLFSAFRVYQKKSESEKDVADAQKQLLDLSAKNTALVQDIDRLQTDEGLEAEIRNKYSVAKAEEKVVVLVEEEKKVPSPEGEKVSFWKRLGEFFGF